MAKQTLVAMDGLVLYFPNFFDRVDEQRLWKSLESEIDWQQESIVMFGRKVLVPRKTAYYGEFPYRYSGMDHPARNLPSILTEINEAISQMVEIHCDTKMNSVLCNRYQDGSESMGWHRDNEPEIDPECIASVSFGGTRKFKFRHCESREVVDVELESGSLLLMIQCQKTWQHQLPKTKKLVDPRINLTYRRVLPRPV